MKIRWYSEAIQDLVAFREYIRRDNPQAASFVGQRILQVVSLLKDQLALGRLGRVEGTRELIVSGLPFTIPYRVRHKEIQILRVLHQSRRPTSQ
jgi:addiction module RelE/StbE family toxin